MKEIWSSSTAIILIKNDVEENKTLTAVIKFFFPEQQVPSEKSVEFITKTFVHYFTLSLPEKGKDYIETFLNTKIPDEDFITKWIDIVHGHKSDSKLYELIEKAPFYHIFKDLNAHNITIDLTVFYTTLRKNFQCFFLETKRMKGILEVYRCLLYCKIKTKRSKVFCQAVKKLWIKLNFENVVELELGENVDDDNHSYFLSIVEELRTTDNNKIIKQKIEETFANENISFETRGQNLAISGHKIVLTNIYEKMKSQIKENCNLTGVELCAKDIILDQDLHLPGKNLILISANLSIPIEVKINLSGDDAIDTFGLNAAESGKAPGENGQAGENGKDGDPSGNFTIFTRTISDTSNLKIYLNGGNGSKGQDGGDGADGENGKGAEIDIIDRDKVKIKMKHVVNVITAGVYSKIMDTEYESVTFDGTLMFSNDSANSFKTHSYRLYKGSKGKEGGKGGTNGVGGKGGESGDFRLNINNCVVKDIVEVDSSPGNDAPNGNVGENGQPGFEGWDIAITAKTLEKQQIYGASKNQKLDIEFFEKADDSTIFVSSRNNSENKFKCHAKILPQKIQRSQLKMEEKTVTTERKNELLARKANPIDQEDARDKYQQLTCTVFADAAVAEQEEVEAEYEESTEINRLYDPYVFKYEEYQPKPKCEPRIITTQEITNIEKGTEEWSILWKFPSDFNCTFSNKLFNKAPNDLHRVLLTKKEMIAKLRRENDEEINWKKTRNEIVEAFQEFPANYYNDFIITEEVAIETKLKSLVTMFGEDGEYLCRKLELLYLKCNALGLTLINSLLLIFESEGMHIDLSTLNFLLETIFYSTNSTNNIQYLFPSILLTTTQSKWIDEIFLFISENSYTLLYDEKRRLMECLNDFFDENIKILFCEKLFEGGPGNNIPVDEMLSILDDIKNSQTICSYLKHLKLKDWKHVIDRHNLYDIAETCNITDIETKKLAVFYHDKMAEKFNPAKVKSLFDSIAKFVESRDKKVVGKFFQRLCNNEIISGAVKSEDLEKIFECILKIDSDEEIEKNNEIYKIAKELLDATEKEPRKSEDLHKLCQKLNKSNRLSTIINAMKEPLEQEIQDEINKCHNLLKDEKCYYDFSFSAFERLTPNSNDAEMKHSIFLLEIIDKVIKDQRGFCLRDTQKLAILCALNNKDNENKMKSVLQQISTGEGKTLIIAALSIILVLKNARKLKVNIVTSSPVLAKREIESSNGCLFLYQAFKINAGHVCDDSQERRTKVYATCDVIYGDLTVYQSDYLQHNFLSKNILGARVYVKDQNDPTIVVIVDEVDSMLLDNGLNMLYLSHEIAEFELLQPIFTKIWQIVNVNVNGKCKNDELYQKIYSAFFPSISWQNFAESISIEKDEFKKSKNIVQKFQEILITNKIVDESGRILPPNYNQIATDEATQARVRAYLMDCKIIDENGNILVSDRKWLKFSLFKINEVNSQIKNRFLCLYDSIMKENYITVPRNLHNYVINHLQEFIDNAKKAIEMKEGIQYQIETVSKLRSRNLESRIVIIDPDTGVDLPTTQWTKGLQQFLQLKHGLRLTPISMKAVYISNVSYLQQSNCIFGFTGTLGAEAEKEELKNFYKNLECITIPSSFPKQFYEKPAILTHSKDDYYMEIFNSLKTLMENGRSALVIADSIKLVTTLKREISRIAKSTPEVAKLFIDALVYKRDYETLKYADGTTLLPPKTIIFSTNLAGRGTDIKISKELEENGGLHVIVAFLPSNIRIEEQAYGRAARCGEPGTAQLIVYEKYEKSFLKLKAKRNKRENERIQHIKEHYSKQIEPEEHCFLNFSAKLKHLKRQLKQSSLSEECYEILCKDIIDQYALELDASVYGPDWVLKMEKFCIDLTTKYPVNKDTAILPLQPSNILRYAAKMAYDKNIDEANVIFKKLGHNYPEYLPESKYYSAIYIIKKRENPALLNSLESILNEAKNGFFERLNLYASNISNTDLYRITDNNEIFYNDDFQLQQQQCEHLTLSIIQSINEFLGQSIEPTDFICDSLKEEASMLVYENLRNYANSPIINGYKICDDYDEEKLEVYCRENGVNFATVQKDLKCGTIINENHLRGLFEIQSYQDFWQALKAADLLEDVRTVTLIDTTKLSPMTEENVRHCFAEKYDFEQQHLLQYPNIKHWKRFTNTKDIYIDLIKCFKKNRIVQTTEFGSLSSSYSKEKAILYLGTSITVKNLCEYGVSEENAQNLLTIMVNKEILELKNEGEYTISPKFLWEECEKHLPKWCHRVFKKMIEKKFAYIFAYLDLLNNDTRRIIKRLHEDNDKTFVEELMELGILESNNAMLNALQKPVPGGDIFDSKCGFLLNNNDSQHYLKALSAAQNTIKKTFTKPQHHKSIVSRTSKEQIENVLRKNASARQKYEKLDIQFLPIQDALNDLNIDGIKVRPVTHSLPYLISPCEMRWSKKTLITLGVVGSGAAVQLAAGISLVIVTFGIGAFAGKFLITEGISDAMFCVKGAWNGKSDNFIRHKTTSMALNIALCGITEPLKYVKAIPSILNSDIVNVIRKSDIFISGGGSFLKTLIPSFTKMKKCETKRNFTAEAINFTIQELNRRFSFVLEEIFESTETLKTNMFQLIKNMGVNNAEKSFKEYDGIFLRDAKPNMLMFSFVVAEVNKKSVKNSTINLENYREIIGIIMQTSKFEQYMHEMKQEIDDCIFEISEMIKQKAEKNVDSAAAAEESENLIIQSVSKTIESWKILLQKRFKYLVEEKIHRPLNMLNNMEYQNQLREIVSEASQKSNSVIQRAPPEASIKDFYQKSKTEYYFHLENLLETTQDSEIFAELTLKTARNHQICVNSIAKLIKKYLKQPITIFIKYKHTQFTGTSNEAKNMDADSFTPFRLEQPLENDDDTSIPNLYEQLIRKVPGLNFRDFTSFKNELSEFIKDDVEFRERVSKYGKN